MPPAGLGGGEQFGGLRPSKRRRRARRTRRGSRPSSAPWMPPVPGGGLGDIGGGRRPSPATSSAATVINPDAAASCGPNFPGQEVTPGRRAVSFGSSVSETDRRGDTDAGLGEREGGCSARPATAISPRPDQSHPSRADVPITAAIPSHRRRRRSPATAGSSLGAVHRDIPRVAACGLAQGPRPHRRSGRCGPAPPRVRMRPRPHRRNPLCSCSTSAVDSARCGCAEVQRRARPPGLPGRTGTSISTTEAGPARSARRS